MRTFLPFLFFLFLLVSELYCETIYTDIRPGSTVSTYISEKIFAKPEITFSSRKIFFGEINIGYDTTITVNLKNTGNSDLTVDDVQISGENYDYFTIADSNKSFRIVPDASRNIDIRFRPLNTSYKTAVMTFISDADSSDSIIMEGIGHNPTIKIPYYFIDFGSIPVSTKKDTILTIKNIDSEERVLNGIRLMNNSIDFSVEKIKFPIFLASLDSIKAKIYFNPTSAGAMSSQLNIITDRFGATILLSGNGTVTDVPENNLENSISLFPNPVTNTLNLKHLTTGSKIQIINSMGQTVFEKQTNNDNLLLDVQDFAPGIYLIKYKSKIYNFIKL